MSFFLGTRKRSTQVVRLGVALVSAFLLAQFVSLYLSWPKQIVLGGLSIVLALVIGATSRSQLGTLALMLFSLATTLRYAWWRLHMVANFFADESNHHLTVNTVLMFVLLGAEAYTILIMVLGFMQTSSPLRRKPIPLPPDESLWPHVDVLIPTYNEPLALVRYTALAANNMDYPPDKLHVSILDDGTRPAFREFAEQAGVGYVVRAEHPHAKAGNINHALTHMDSPLVTIFDCDHVPTRSFLQVTVGWFLTDHKLGMLQTPHFFYSPDPFERNLLRYKSIPNEGELFYGIIQDGNDLWNATFFCGSCAVIRRTALDEVGGIATETVTEDAHTSLRMQKKGWNTAYVNLPQAAGLATETLAAHVGQRVRWARGMVQILRVDNPLFGGTLKLTQRLCYFNAMLHFLYAIPRIVFLCSPLVYMLGGFNIIPGYWVAILAYSMPHLVLSNITNSRVQGKHRHSFWNEIYETVLAPYILMPTLLALINPKLGEFNVTDKGGTLEETTYDRHIAAPTAWLLLLNFLGLCAVPFRLWSTHFENPGTVLSNVVWIVFNMVILGVAAAVANEQRQRRSSVRIPAHIPIRLHLAGNQELTGITTDISVGGTQLSYTDRAELAMGGLLTISFPMQTGESRVHAKIVGLQPKVVRLQFDAATIEEQETLTCAIYSRADSWISARSATEEDRPLVSLARILRLSATGFRQILRSLVARPAKPASTTAPIGKAAPKAAVAALLLMMCTLAAHAQIPGAILPGSAPATAPAQPDDASASEPLGRDLPHAAAAVNTPAPKPVAAPPALTLHVPATALLTAQKADERISFKQMGVHGAIDLHGPHSYQSVGFVLGHSRVPTAATLNLSLHFSADLLPRTGLIRVLLNRTPIADIASPEVPQAAGEYSFLALPLPAELLVRNNELTFEFTGGTLLQVESRARSVALGNIGATSTVLIAGQPIPFQKDLSLLPLPFLDRDLQTDTTLSFIFPTQPSPQTLQAAAVVASWFGLLSTSRPVRFRAVVGQLPTGNAILFSSAPASLPAGLNVPPGGASMSLRTNPTDPASTVLVLAGDDDGQLLNVARSLALMTVANIDAGDAPAKLGDSARIGDFPLPAQRRPDDAPRWLSTDHLDSLWSSGSAAALRTTASASLPLYLRVPPDLYFGERDNLDLHLSYRYNAQSLAAGSALRLYMNGALVNDAALEPGSGNTQRDRMILLPVASLRPFGSTMLFNFDFVPARPGEDDHTAATRLSGAILRNSYLDLRGLAHWAAMPNLELFANAGFPFTRTADLAETVVVMPTAPTPAEITLLLYLMSHCGAQTGYPALRVDISGPEAVMRGDRDYLMLGGQADQPAIASLAGNLPVTFDAEGVHVKQTSGFTAWLRGLWRRVNSGGAEPAQPSNADGLADMMIEGIESPFFHGRSIVVMSMRSDAAVDEFADAFLERSQSSDISQSVALLRGGNFASYQLQGATYHVGEISAYSLLRIRLAENFWLLLVVIAGLSLCLARYARDYLALVAAARLRHNGQPSPLPGV